MKLSSMQGIRFVIGCCVLILALCGGAYGQVSSAQLGGAVTDNSGAVIGGAHVTIVNAGTGASFASTMRDALLDMGRQSDLAGLGYKDLLLALEEARSRQLPLPVTALATQYLSAYFQGHDPSQASAKHP